MVSFGLKVPGQVSGGTGGGDAYSNITLDLDKIKLGVPKTKPYEYKSEEEKKKDSSNRKTNTRSCLKTWKSSHNKSVSFGRSIVYEFKEADDD